MTQDHQDPNSSSAELEASNVLRTILQNNPLPEIGNQEIPADGAYNIDDQRVRTLDCVAFVKQGKIIPLFDLAGTPIPQTVEGKIYLSTMTARVILDGVLDGLEFITQHHQDGESS
jgi:hypothetical protein